MPDIPDNLLILFSIVFGLAAGSFITALNYRLPLGKDWIFTRSSCSKCGHVLGVFDLVPFISWALAGGKCRYCKEKIGVEYLLIEIIAALWSLFSFYFCEVGWPEKGIIFSGGMVLLLMAAIDFKHKILPDGLQIIAFGLAAAYVFLNGLSLSEAAIGAVIAFSFSLLLEKGYFILRKKPGLGMGDVKFFATAGLICGVYSLPLFLFLSGLFGVGFGLLWARLKGEEAFPFGPAMFAAVIVTMLLKSHMPNFL